MVLQECAFTSFILPQYPLFYRDPGFWIPGRAHRSNFYSFLASYQLYTNNAPASQVSISFCFFINIFPAKSEVSVEDSIHPCVVFSLYFLFFSLQGTAVSEKTAEPQLHVSRPSESSMTRPHNTASLLPRCLCPVRDCRIPPALSDDEGEYVSIEEACHSTPHREKQPHWDSSTGCSILR